MKKLTNFLWFSDPTTTKRKLHRANASADAFDQLVTGQIIVKSTSSRVDGFFSRKSRTNFLFFFSSAGDVFDWRLQRNQYTLTRLW